MPTDERQVGRGVTVGAKSCEKRSANKCLEICGAFWQIGHDSQMFNGGMCGG